MRRRNFLKNISLLGGWMGLPAMAMAQGNNAREDGVAGTVLSSGKPIAGVAVTDGFSVVITDAKGRYQLEPHMDAKFVYVSLPSGHQIPHQQGIAAFYQPIAYGKKQYDFSLEKLNRSDAKHQFVVWADTQMISLDDCAQLKKESVPDLQQLVASYGNDALFHGIGCGDLVWDKFDLFAEYKQAIGLTGVPFYNVIGNHDMDLDGRSDEMSASRFQQEFGPTYYSFNRGKIHYVVLDDVFFLGTSKRYIGYISEQQLRWLAKDLALVPNGATVVLSLHIPTHTGAVQRNKAKDDFGGTVSNRAQLYKMLEGYKVHIMSGHTHFNESWQKDHVTEHNHGTVCGAWWTGPICSDGTPAGYGVYEVDGNEISWYYKGTGRAKTQQLRIYPLNKSTAHPGQMMVNVWNWDAAWKVEWMQDGQAMGAATQVMGLDPWAEELYTGPKMPAKHKFVEPTLTDHLFVIKPSATAKEVTVRATDRFGNVYEEKAMMG